MFVFTYHKVGTVLMMNAIDTVAAALGLTVTAVAGRISAIPSTDIVVFMHSLVAADLSKHDFRGVRLVRDPRDIWLSGYFYHRTCTEAWCTNTDLSATLPILYPKVPASRLHLPDVWKRHYLQSLRGRSYQQNLLRLPQSEGLAFELDGYAGWTIESMLTWNEHPAVRDVPMETLAADFDGTMRAIFSHLGLDGEQLDSAVRLAAQHDVARMSDIEVSANPHIHSRELSKWRKHLTDADLARFEDRFPGAPDLLGYPDEPSGNLQAAAR
jgi:hypothetical protein